MSLYSRRTVFISLFILLFLLPIAAFASFPTTLGIFIIRDFSNSHLLWQPTDSGNAVDLGALGAGASRIHTGANYLMVAHSGSFANGVGSSLWYATFDSVARAINRQRSITWNVCNFADYSNAYDVVWSNGFAWVTLLGTSRLMKINLATNTIVDSIPTGLNPQDIIAVNGNLYVSASGYGYGNQLFVHQISPAQVDSFTVGINPQGLFYDQFGNVDIACSGRSWETPTVRGGLSILTTQIRAVNARDTTGVFYPASVCVTASGRTFLGDEYGVPQCKEFIYNEYTHIVTFQSLPFTGGWQLLATPDSGVYVVSMGDSTIRKYGSDNLFVAGYSVGGAPAAACYWEGQTTTSAPEPQNPIATHFELPNVYPNPFNSSAQVHYRLPNQSMVRLVLFNSIGQEIGLLANGRQTAGEHIATINGTRLSSGTYFLSMEAAGTRAVRTIQLLK